MKKILKNLFLFIVLSVVLSGFFAACKSTSTQKGAVIEADANNISVTKNETNSVEVDKNNFPPLPSGIAQAEIKDLDGKTFKLEDKKGKVVLINLWALWCGPCVAEMPEFAKLQDEYKDKGFEVIGLNTGDQETGDPEPADSIKTFAETRKINYQLAYADEKLFSEFIRLTRMSAIPQTILINREGKMTGIFKGGGPRIVGEIKDAVAKTVN